MTFLQSLYESSWFGIEFKAEGLAPSVQRRADSVFYDRFYDLFYQKFSGWSALPKNYRSHKDAAAELIYTDTNSTYLSIGCGNGYIENSKAQDFQIEAFDFSTQATQWLREHSNIVVHNHWHSVQKTYGVIYAVQLVYSLSIPEVKQLFDDAKNHLDKGGQFVFSFTPPDGNLSNLQILKKIVRLFLTHTIWRQRFQFWGWMRTEQFYVEQLLESGFKLVSSDTTDTEVVLRCEKA